MDDGELDFSNQEVLSNSNIGEMLLSSCSMDTFFDDLLKDTHACTHTHTCNPPGPDYTHSHTCFHVHTKILPAQSQEKVSTDDTAESSEKKKNNKKRPLGNREAVRKYREKKKARAASLEDEVTKLRAVNQQLLKRLQGQATLEAEVSRLKCLLVDIRGRIEGEIGSFPYKKRMNANFPSTNAPGSDMMNPCNLQCDDQVHCLHPGVDGNSGEVAMMNGQGLTGCEFDQLQCLANQNLGIEELPACGVGNAPSSARISGANKRNGGPRKARAG